MSIHFKSVGVEGELNICLLAYFHLFATLCLFNPQSGLYYISLGLLVYQSVSLLLCNCRSSQKCDKKIKMPKQPKKQLKMQQSQISKC